MRRLALASMAAMAACGGAPPAPGPTGSAAPRSGAAAREAASLPAGVVAERRTERGRVCVEERDGLRLLTLDGAVQGAAPIGGAGGADPLAPLLRKIRPRRARVLLLGLGTGKTALDLRAAGFEVTAVERSRAVAELARAYFGYRGAVEIADAVDFLKRRPERYDVLIVDGWIPSTDPPMLSARPSQQETVELTDAERAGQALARGVLAHVRERLSEGGIVVVRSVDSPGSRNLRILRQRIQSAVGSRYQHLYGDGVADEPQNLVLVSSQKPMNVIEIDGCALWHIEPRPTRSIPEPAIPSASALALRGALRASRPPPATRSVTLSGYLVRLDDGALALDLPHWEMGAVRYLLTEPSSAVAELAARLPKDASFPTDGDIGSDGDTAGTLRAALGGGGVLRSELRFSPVAVRLTGEARLISVVHPDAAEGVPERAARRRAHRSASALRRLALLAGDPRGALGDRPPRVAKAGRGGPARAGTRVGPRARRRPR